MPASEVASLVRYDDAEPFMEGAREELAARVLDVVIANGRLFRRGDLDTFLDAAILDCADGIHVDIPVENEVADLVSEGETAI